MELRQLRHFVALAELASFTMAARREHIVQSGLSNSVQALEREIGATLYVRGSRPVRLTAEGDALVDPARRALLAAETAVEAVREVQHVVTGQLRIGVVRSALHLFPMLDLVAQFCVECPRVQVSILQQPTSTTLSRIAGGDIDIGIVTSTPVTVDGVRLLTVAEEELVLACRDDHPLAGRSTVDLADLNGERFVDVRADWWSARSMIDTAFIAEGLSRTIAVEVNEWELVLDLVQRGVGIALVPDGVALEAIGGDGSVLRRVAVSHGLLRRHIQLALPMGENLTPAAATFMRIARLSSDSPEISQKSPQRR